MPDTANFYTDGIYKHIGDPTHAADSVVVMLPQQVIGWMLLFAPDPQIEPNKTSRKRWGI